MVLERRGLDTIPPLPSIRSAAGLSAAAPAYTGNGNANGTCNGQRQSQNEELAAQKRLPALTIEEYEEQLRRSASDLQLVERVFYGGIESNELRAALWPYLFGLVKHRGKFRRAPVDDQPATCCGGNAGNGLLRRQDSMPPPAASCGAEQVSSNGLCKSFSFNLEARRKAESEFSYIEHEENVKRWRELEKLYKSYESQWKSISHDQEMRFSTFRERKSLIERDVVRSDRAHPFYAENSENLSNFTTLLMTYMMYDFDIGYLQGMSDLAAPILYVFKGNLVKSFWVFVEVMKLFRRNFEQSQKTIHFQLNCLFRLIKLTDPKFASYLNKNECSNCFFAFRCIVCQFKRELMRGTSNTCGANSQPDDYSKVLQLWDTIWFVQRRHELQTRSKFVHTFTIASGHKSAMRATRNGHQQKQAKTSCNGNSDSNTNSQSNSTAESPRLSDRQRYDSTSSSRNHQNHRQQQHNSNFKPPNQSNNLQHIKSPQNGASHNKPPTNGAAQTATQNGPASKANGHFQGGGCHMSASDTLSCSPTTTATTTTRKFSNGSCASYLSPSEKLRSSQSTLSLAAQQRARQHSITSLNGSSPSVSINGLSMDSSSCCGSCFGQTSCGGGTQTVAPPVKQEQIVYTKETFYSSFDPNQADVPRFELTQTEKFMLSLCLSLIRRERDYIIVKELDAAGIHQHFIMPQLANDLDSFIGSAYEIYQYLNTYCDLRLLVKGANEFGGGGAADLSPINCANGLGSGELGQSDKDAADTYDLLKDYLIISPTQYDTPPSLSSSPAKGGNLLATTNGAGGQPQLLSGANGMARTITTKSFRRQFRNGLARKAWDHFANSNSALEVE